MSQTCITEHAQSWDVEECRKQLHSALPSVVNQFKTTEKPFGLMHLLYTKFVAAAGVRQMESLVFSQIAQQTEEMFNAVFVNVVDMLHSSVQLQELQHQIQAELQNALDMIGCLEECISGIIATGEEIHMSDVHSLIPLTVQAIHKSYEHCKRSSTEYGDLLGTFSKQLSSLFKQVHSLQMGFLGLLDKVKVEESPSESDIEDICFVLQSIHSIAQLGQSLDVKLTITLWKAFSKMACQYKYCVRDKLEISPILVSFCENMSSSLKYALDLAQEQGCGENTDKAFSKAVKVLGFQMKMLVRLVEEYISCLDDLCIAEIHHLSILILESSPPSLKSQSVIKQYAVEIDNHLTNAIPSLVGQLYSLPHFCNTVLNFNHKDESKSGLGQLLLLLHIADTVHRLSADDVHIWYNAPRTENPSNQPEADVNSASKDNGAEPSCRSTATDQTRRESLLHAIFEAFACCYVETLDTRIKLPGVQRSGKAQEYVTLYEYVVVKICALFASCPQQYFSIAEACLLENVLRRQRLTAILAIDVWCFLARFGSAELCRDHCVFVSALYASLPPTHAVSHLKMLVARLVKFLAPEHQREYVERFSVEKNPCLWSVLPIHVFSADICADLSSDIIRNTVTCVREFRTGDKITLTQFLNLKQHVQCLTKLLRYSTVVERHVTASHFKTIVSEVTPLLALLATFPDVQELGLLSQCINGLLELSALLTHTMQNSQIVQLLEFIEQLQRDNNTSTVAMKLSTLAVLGPCSSITFQPCSQQPRILDLLATLFRRLLSDKNPVVYQQSVSVFADFAETTSHESVVPACLDGSDTMQQAVVTYLNKIAERHHAESTYSVEQIQSQYAEMRVYWREKDKVMYSVPCYQSWFDEYCLEQPETKRQRLEEETPNNELEEKLQITITKLKSNAVEVTQTLKQFSAVPNWAKKELEDIQRTLQNYL